jgi:hypothetical protein
LGEKTKIEFPIWVYSGGMYTINFPFEMGEDLKTLHGEAYGRGTTKLSITMKKIED